MLNERMMMMMFIKPTPVIMVISEGAACADNGEESRQNRQSDIILNSFHVLK